MSDSLILRTVNRETDVLYRKVDPDHWDHDTGNLLPTAFQDPYANLSFFVARFKTPRDVLYFFRSKTATKQAAGISSSVPPDRMYRVGFTISAVLASDFQRLGLEYIAQDGHEISQSGHVNVRDGQHHAIQIRGVARCLTEQEIFPP